MFTGLAFNKPSIAVDSLTSSDFYPVDVHLPFLRNFEIFVQKYGAIFSSKESTPSRNCVFNYYRHKHTSS